jgi:hypothetical protein
MQASELLEAAKECRIQSQAFEGRERRLLVRVADMFETLASSDKAKNNVAATRCW